MAVHWTREKLDVDVGLLFASGCALGATVSISCALVLSQPFDFPSINFPRPYRRPESPSLVVLMTFGPFGVIPTSTLLLLISSPSKIERTEADALGTFETFSRLLFRACRAAPLYCVCGAPTLISRGQP